MFDGIAIGDTTQDIFLKMHDAHVQCGLDGHNCRLCFDYGDKIAVDEKTDVPGVGNAANHAIGLARLGLKSAIYTVVGNDDEGHKTEAVFQQEKVDTRYLAYDEKRGTNLSVVINFQAERTIFVYHEPREYVLPELEDAHWIYLTSASGSGLNALHEQVEAYLKKNPNVQLAFNPGTHQMKLGLDKLRPLLERTALLFLNREESARVLGIDTRDIVMLTKGFHDIGVQSVVITDGPGGAYASDGKQIYFQGIYDAPVVERTGAGDAYGSGFLSAIMHGKTMPQAMEWGNANSTSVIQYVGAREGLLTVPALEAMIKANPSCLVQPYDPSRH